MTQAQREQFANDNKDYYCAIQFALIKKCDLKKIVDECWTVWSKVKLSDMSSYEKIFEQIFLGNGLRMTYWIGYSENAIIPKFETKPMSFYYDDEFAYEENCWESNLMENLNAGHSEIEWKAVLMNYLLWSGYVQE